MTESKSNSRISEIPEDDEDQLTKDEDQLSINENGNNGAPGEEKSDEEADEDDNMELLITPWNQNSFIGKFINWMCSVDGKSRSLRQARQHARQVEIIIKDASDGTFDVSCLFDRKIIREKWLDRSENTRKPGTIKSFLYSLIHFYKYLVCDKPAEFESKFKMTLIIQNWITVYRKKCSLEHWKKDLQDLEQMITPQQISALDQSNTVATAKKILANIVKENPSFKDFTLARDYLMMYICIDNASRTGAIANMTIKEFKNAKNEGGSFIVKVLNNKTIATAGPACIVFRTQLYNEVDNFLAGLRKSFTDLDTTREDPVFISFSGKKLSSSMVTTQLNSFWQKALGKGQHRFNATRMRKASVTMTHNKRPEMKKNLSNLMVHSIKMAEKTYYLQDRAKEAAETSRNLREVIREYEENEDEALKRIFSKEIFEKKIRIGIVRDKRQSFPDVLAVFNDDQIRDKIRYLINCAEINEKDQIDDDSSNKVPNNENEDVSDGDIILPSIATSSSTISNSKYRVKFSAQQTNTIVAKFGMLITGKGTISQAEILKVSEKDPVVEDLVKQFGLYRMTEKVRTERKKFKRGQI